MTEITLTALRNAIQSLNDGAIESDAESILTWERILHSQSLNVGVVMSMAYEFNFP